MRLTTTLLLFALLAGLSCQRTQPAPEPVQYNVPAGVEPYVQHFRDETRTRGQRLPVDNLIVTFSQTTGNDICGQCLLETGKTPRIVISTDANCWQNASDNERECLVFHELGHCLLKRGHRLSRFPNNAYVSLMNPSDRAVYATCAYPIGGDVCDKRDRRGYYLDELADSTTAVPVWGK